MPRRHELASLDSFAKPPQVNLRDTRHLVGVGDERHK